jgi:hypothetical protein
MSLSFIKMRAQQRGNHYLQRKPLSFKEVSNQPKDEFQEVIEPIGATEDVLEDDIEGGNIIYKSVMRPVKRGAGFQRRNSQGGEGIATKQLKEKLKSVREMSGLGLLNFDGPKVKDTAHRNIKLLL